MGADIGSCLEPFRTPFAAAHQGIVLREQGELVASENIFLGLVGRYPHLPYGWQELGLLYIRCNKLSKALYVLRRAVEAAPHDIQPRIHCAHHLLSVGRTVEADMVLAAHVPADASEQTRVTAAREFLKFLSLFPEHRALTIAHELEKGGRFLDVRAVERRIFAAAQDRTPFSLVRLGDGEGAWIAIDKEDEALFPTLYRENRRELLRLWFDDASLHEDQSFHDLAARMFEATATTDVLGVPSSLRVAREYRIKSIRGVASNLNLLRWIRRRRVDDADRFCSQDIHLDLQFSGFYRRLFDAGFDIGIVTCHAELAALIKARTGVDVAETHLVPEEKGFSDIIGSRLAEAHFPTAFDRVMGHLDRPQSGRVWLVAAGFLGKLYCAQIKQQGGIALDVGSIVDGWLGKLTRPTLQRTERFAL